MEEDDAGQPETDRIPITEWPVCSPFSSVSDHDQTPTASSHPDKLQMQQSHPSSALLNVRPSQPLRKRGQELTSQPLPLKYFRESDKESDEYTEPLAPVRVAKWWRKQRHLVSNLKIPSNNPNTRLYHISRTKECKDFLQDEKKKLSKRLPYCSVEHKASIHAALASIEDWLNLPELALKNITIAVDLCASNPEYLWWKEKLSKQCKVLHIQKEFLRKINKSSKDSVLTEKVERVSGQSLSVEDFKEKYVKTGKPVIIEDVVSTMVKETWDLEYLKVKAGSLHAPVKRNVPGSVEWAKLEEDRVVTVAEHIDNIQQGETRDYLFDWSLPLHCPQLAAEIITPKYFTDNFLRQTLPGSLYHDSWPSLFVAPPGVTSDLHVDAFASSFWMALFHGQKRWTFYAPDDLPLLYPKYPHSLDPVFSVDVAHPDLETFPLLALTKPKECVLKPGDLLFVPAGSPHFVENLTASVAVSSNYVDATNYPQVCEELRVNGLLDPRARQLLEQLKSSEFTAKVMSQSR